MYIVPSQHCDGRPQDAQRQHVGSSSQAGPRLSPSGPEKQFCVVVVGQRPTAGCPGALLCGRIRCSRVAMEPKSRHRLALGLDSTRPRRDADRASRRRGLRGKAVMAWHRGSALRCLPGQALGISALAYAPHPIPPTRGWRHTAVTVALLGQKHKTPGLWPTGSTPCREPAAGAGLAGPAEWLRGRAAF